MTTESAPADPAPADPAPAESAPAESSSTDAAVPPAGGVALGRWPRTGVLAGLAGGAVAMLVTLVVVLRYGGGAPQPVPEGLAGADAGPITGWGLPISRVVCDAAATATVGALLAVAFLLPAAGGRPGPAGRRMLRSASAAAWVWCLASLTQFAFTVSDLVGRPLPTALSRATVNNVLDSVPQPRALLITAGLALALAIGGGVARRLDSAAWLTVVALAALVPVASTGHVHGSGGHDIATVSNMLHIVGAAAWVGALVAVLVAGRALAGPELVTAVTRYSRIAGLCLVVVGASGVVNAIVRLGTVSALVDTRYGTLVLAKGSALVILAAFGAAHRRRTIGHLAPGAPIGRPVRGATAAASATSATSATAASPTSASATSGSTTSISTTSGGAVPGGPVRRGIAAGDRRPFLRLGLAEVAVMSVTIALAVGLSRTPPPVAAAVDDDPVVSILGFPMPPALTPTRLFTEVRPDLLFLTLVALGGWLYLTGLVRLRRAGGSWPAGRTICWLLGLAVVAITTSSGLGRYGRVLFSVHMAQHLLLMMVAPILLVLGGPVTLALRALPSGVTGTTRSARAWLLRIVNSRLLGFVSHPVPALLLYATSAYILYLSPLFGWMLQYHLAHLAVMLHFLLVGYLFFWIMIGIDPGPRRPSHPIRILMLFMSSGVHALFGVIVMVSPQLLASDYYSRLPRTWGASPLDDQVVGGGIAWSFGELPTLLVLAALFFQWARTEERRGRAKDARMDSGEDDEFEAYNRYLARLNGAQPRTPADDRPTSSFRR